MTIENTILVQIKNIYGNEMIYPANQTAQHFANIAGTKTLSVNTLRNAKLLGFTIDTKKADLGFTI